MRRHILIKDILILAGLTTLSTGVCLRFGTDAALMVGGAITLALGVGIRK